MNLKLKSPIILIIVLAISFRFLSISSFANAEQYIRVAIIPNTTFLNLKINGSYEILNSINSKVLYRGKNLKTTVTAYNNGILIGETNLNTDKVLIRTKDPQATFVDNRRFKGDIMLVKKENLRLLIINSIELEEYIKGILYNEASHYWPPEALKAQVVVSRTYALYQIQESKSKDYDVTADIYSQVYGGQASERYRTNKAVDETIGEALTYQDKIFPTYFHATCAGHTEDASLLWNINITPLKGVVCKFCQGSPHFKWQRVLSLVDIKNALVKSGYNDSQDIKDIVIVVRDPSGRVTQLKIITDKKDIKISAKDFRDIVGPNIIRSTNFNLTIVEGNVVFEGLGWGHGVGLCQWGAYFMAKQGYNYKQILTYYYPQTNVKTIGF
jgi:stage II sporulation protein D